MNILARYIKTMRPDRSDTLFQCYHCGEQCADETIVAEDHHFCCQGCKLVFELLCGKGLGNYYTLGTTPGINRSRETRENKFAFLDNEVIAGKLLTFQDDQQTHLTLHLPQIHCSSCLYLLENLHKINTGVIRCDINFPLKEASIILDHRLISLRQLAGLLAKIGYEPSFNLKDLGKKSAAIKKSLLYQLGVAGFCFANIMLLSFPEYLGLDNDDASLRLFFRWLSLILSLPVIGYAALPFFKAGWEGIRSRYLNIDAPIALAIIVTFVRSCYEVINGSGSGYFDSMSGIVFFMLAGRVLQNKTYQELSFERDYQSYFPISATKVAEGTKISVPLPEIKTGDTLSVHDGELIPVDGIISAGNALIDYAFVTGEVLPVRKQTGQLIYAGGKLKGDAIEILVMREVEQSYLTGLWSRNTFNKGNAGGKSSFVHLLSRYFTYIVLCIAASGALYWWYADSGQILNVVTAVLIVACPCALLLSNTFTNAYILRLLGSNRFYLRSAQVIEDITKINHIVFDKTGTLTSISKTVARYTGIGLTDSQANAVAALAAQSDHPASRAISALYPEHGDAIVTNFSVTTGSGISGIIANQKVSIGRKSFVTSIVNNEDDEQGTYISFNGVTSGKFILQNQYRRSIPGAIRRLSRTYQLSVISGDNGKDAASVRRLIGKNSKILFNQTPDDKLQFIRDLQAKGKKVMMIGDGLNDAGALLQSDVGIAVTEDRNNFTPSSDAILDTANFSKLPAFLQLCKTNKNIVRISFTVSIVYNIIGITLAVKGLLMPVIAAVLMPASSLSILIISYSASHLAAWKKGLRVNA